LGLFRIAGHSVSGGIAAIDPGTGTFSLVDFAFCTESRKSFIDGAITIVIKAIALFISWAYAPDTLTEFTLLRTGLLTLFTESLVRSTWLNCPRLTTIRYAFVGIAIAIIVKAIALLPARFHWFGIAYDVEPIKRTFRTALRPAGTNPT
tara:strand:- start:105 stop:551 length:447 start_codon:yes stop_codon:yes gene_type:complete